MILIAVSLHGMTSKLADVFCCSQNSLAARPIQYTVISTENVKLNNVCIISTYVKIEANICDPTVFFVSNFRFPKILSVLPKIKNKFEKRMVFKSRYAKLDFSN